MANMREFPELEQKLRVLALTDTLGSSVIVSATDEQNADAIIDEMAANAKRYVRQNWRFVKDQMPPGLAGDI